MPTTIQSGNLKGIDLLEDLDVDGTILLEWILEKEGGRLWSGYIWLRIGTRDGFL